MEDKSAIVLAMFGTTVEAALQGLLGIREKIKQKYPRTPVRIAFTSNFIRKIWRKRATDVNYAATHPQVPDDIPRVQGPLAVIANLQDAGYNCLVVQATYITPAEEYQDLCRYVEALESIKTTKPKYKPFRKLAVGRPALGAPGTQYPYARDIARAATALAADAQLAGQQGAALVYMGHGNQYYPSSGAYLELAARMREHYPGVRVYIGSLEGFPSINNVARQLKKDGIRKVLLKPFMVVAGNHVKNEMTGSSDKSWKNVLEQKGITVIPVLRGLGEQEAFAEIFAQNAADAAADTGIILK